MLLTALQRISDRAEGVDETPATLVLRKLIADEELINGAIALQDLLSTPTRGTVHFSIESDGSEYDLSEFDQFRGESGNVRIRKERLDGCEFFFTTEALLAWICDNPTSWEQSETIRALDLNTPLHLFTVSLLPADTPLPATAKSVEIPGRIVRDPADTGLRPKAMGCWMLDTGEPPSEVEMRFAEIASPRVALGLVSELWRNDGNLWVSFEGAQRKVAQVQGDAYPAEYLQDAAKWVYGSEEPETHHDLLATEIARLWTDETLPDGLKKYLSPALKNAQRALSIRNSEYGREALRIMGELRKSLAGEVENITKQMSILATSLWRDAALVLVVLLTRVIGKIQSPSLFLAIAVYLCVSFAIAYKISNGVIDEVEDRSRRYRSSLFDIIDPPAYREMFSQPLEKSIVGLKDVRRSVFLVYGALMCVCVGLAFHSFYLAN